MLHRVHLAVDDGYFPPSFSKNKQIVSIPWWKFGMWNFSFGACRLSSGRPKPIITLGIFRCFSKSATIGIDPPERMKTVSLWKTSFIAAVDAFTYLLSVLITIGSAMLNDLILISIPFGTIDCTKSLYNLKISSGRMSGTRRIEILAAAFAGITVLPPAPMNPPGMPWTSRVGLAHVRSSTE